VVHSWDPSAINGPIARFNKIFFRTVIHKLDTQICSTNKEMSQVFKAIFVFLEATHSFIFVDSA
jgi:hypothetical protein